LIIRVKPQNFIDKENKMTSGKTVMLFGLGDLGGWVLEFLARQQGVSKIITLDNREQWGALKTQGAAAGAGHLGYQKTIEFEKCDVTDIDRTAELLKSYNPDFVYSSMGLLSPTLPRFLPGDVHRKLEKISGHLIPNQYFLISNLMKAVKESGIKAPVINNSWPDIVNPMLWRNGFRPLVGAGNLDIVVAYMRWRVSITENIPIPDITIYFIGEHSVTMQGSRTGIPYFLKVQVGDMDITRKFDTDSLVSDYLLPGMSGSTASWIVRPTVASCAVRLIMSILNDSNDLTHAPGPNGMIGGYPIRANARGVEVICPEGITMEEAIQINVDGMKNEGVKEIKDDGTLIVTEEAYELGRTLLGVSWKEIDIGDMEEYCKEGLVRYKKLAEKYRVPLPYN
jgi:malate/lactate dehydrogenase